VDSWAVCFFSCFFGFEPCRPACRAGLFRGSGADFFWNVFSDTFFFRVAIDFLDTTRSNSTQFFNFHAHSDSINSVQWFSDTKSTNVFFSCSNDHTVGLWKAPDALPFFATSHAPLKSLGTLQGHTGPVYQGASFPLSPSRLATCSADRTIKIWDLKSKTLMQDLVGHSGAVNCISVTDGGFLVSGSTDKTLRVFDVETGKCVLQFSGAHSSSITGITTLSQNRILSCGWDQRMQVHDLTSGRLLATFPCDIYFSTIASTANRRDVVLSLGWADDFDLHDLRNIDFMSPDSAPSASVQSFQGHTDLVCDACFIPSTATATGLRIASISKDRFVRVWDPDTALSIAAAPIPVNMNPSCISAGNSHLAVGTADGEIALTDLISLAS
jgi:WD40 repeat protein